MPSPRASRSKKTLPDGPVLLLVGTDSFRIKQIILHLVERKGGESSCDRREYDAAQEETNQAITDAASPSLFTTSRIVVLHNVDKARVEELGAVLSYTRRPADDSVFVMVMGSKSSQKKALKEIASTVPTVIVEAATASDIRGMIQRKLKEAKVALDADALKLLMEHVGNRGEDAMAEVEKIVLCAGPDGRVDREMCRDLLTTEPEEEVWALTRSVAAKDPQAALLNLQRAFEQGLEPIMVLGMLARLFRQMWSVRTAEEERIPRQRWSEVTGLKGYPLEATIRQAGGFSRELLQRGLVRIRETDEDLKGSALQPDMALERLIVELSASP
ncbi:MAG: DNA polymerase III subunit delta [bacterium]